jgi:glutathione S-transferase
VKFYNSLGPNPRLVRMFMLAKGITLDTVEIDIMKGENREKPYIGKNPAGEMPCLELDDGSVLAETVAICEYLEEKHPKPVLIGATAEERAKTRMWIRRIEYQINNPMTDGFRYAEGKPMFEKRRHLIPQAAADLKAIAREGAAWLDAQIAGRPFICGQSLTLADIVLFAFVEFGAGVGQPLDPSLGNLKQWLDRMASRPSAEASLHPIAKAGGMKA